MCGTKLKYLRRGILAPFFGLLLLSLYPAAAQDLPEILPIPTNSLIQNSIKRTGLVLTAFKFEQAGHYKKAKHIWRALDKQSPLEVSQYLYRLDFSSSPHGILMDPPKHEASVLLIVRYLTWLQYWEDALLIVQSHPDLFKNKDELRLEKIRILLKLGRYREAKTELDTFDSSKRRLQMQADIFKSWLSILESTPFVDRQFINRLEEEYLYVSATSIYPPGYWQKHPSLKQLFRRSLVRFPDNRSVFEQNLEIGRAENDWKELETLSESQSLLKKETIDWRLQKEIYLESKQVDKLNELLANLPAHFKTTREYFDTLARKSLIEENWPQLAEIAKEMTSRFPGVKDGLLYKIVWLRKTGNPDAALRLLQELSGG